MQSEAHPSARSGATPLGQNDGGEMSTAMRWIIAIIIFGLGLSAAGFTAFGSAFSTVACAKVPPDWIYYILIFIGILILAASAVSSVLIVRRARAIKAAAPAILGTLLMCVGLVAYFVLLGQYC
jgi:O-antigen/teichoic acid export membrane protein